MTAATERFHESRRRLWLDELRQDFRSARRNLVRYPVVAIVAVLSLGAGIGATAASLTIRDVIFQNPPPLYAEPEQLSKVQVDRQDRPIRPMGSYVPADLYRDLARHDRAHRSPRLDVRREACSDVRMADRVEPTRDARGHRQLLQRARRRPGHRTRVLHRAATRAESARPSSATGCGRTGSADGADAIGATIWIDNRPHTVIGVMPRRFWFSELNDPVWTLLEPEHG